MTRARLTVLEHGAPAMTWATCQRLGADDWIVVAQQSDEGAQAFAQRVRQRVRRLCREGAELGSVDVFAGEERTSPARRRELIDELSRQLVAGGSLTLWSGGRVVEWPEFVGQIAERDERSGVRHAAPTRPSAPELEVESA